MLIQLNLHLRKLCRAVITGYARLGLRQPLLYSYLPAGWARKAVVLGAGQFDEISIGNAPRQLLLDVSEISQRDAGTGVQRVVRNILLHLLHSPPHGYEVKLVYATRHEPYRYARHYRARLLGMDVEAADLPVEVSRGDVFLGLDLVAHLLPRHQRTLGQWKSNGVKLYFLMHDLLPVRRPEWFNPKRFKVFQRWLRTLAIYSDRVICVSKTTADDVKDWFLSRYGIEKEALPTPSFHLGTDFPCEGHGPTSKKAEANGLVSRFRGQRSILMVGTIEPRKGYAQALSAFEELWKQGNQDNLVIVGKAGWKVDQLITRLRGHPEAGTRLHWFEDADDEKLLLLYSTADGLLMASEGEGFGLPVIEAASFHKPLLLRDIPVFKEIAGVAAQYFINNDNPDDLALALQNWLSLISAQRAPSSQAIACRSWAESTEQLVLAMELN